MNPAPSVKATPPARVLDRRDYKLFIGSFVLLAVLVSLLVLLMSTFKQVMAVNWLSKPHQRSRVEVRQYVAILAEEKEVEALDRLRIRPDGMPSLFAAMALAGKGDAGMARLRSEVESGTGERSIAAMAAMEYERPGSLLLFLTSAADPVRWAASVRAATLADIYSTVDFVRDMDGRFIALFPGKKALPAEVMGGYQRGLVGLGADADNPDPLATTLAFHAAQLRAHPELYKPCVLKTIQDSWVTYLTRAFEQRGALFVSQEAVRAAVSGATNLPPYALEAANRFLAGRYPGNPLTLTPAGERALPAGEDLLRRDGVVLRALALSADGGTRVSGGFDNLARVWTGGGEAEPMALTGHAFGILAVAVSPDGARIASAGLDGTIRLWDSASDRQTAAVDAGTRRVSALAFSPDGATLATVGAAGSIRLLDGVTGAERRVLRRHVAEVTALAFTPDGKRLVAGNLDRSLSLWDLADAEAKPALLDKHGDAVWSLVVSPDGRWMASGAGDRRVMIWSLGDKTPKARVLKAHKSAVTALAASADGRWLASAGADHLLVVWDVARGKVSSAHPTDVTVNALQFEPDNKTLLLACEDGTLRRWKVSSRDERPFSFGDWALWLMRKN
jgi:WD40 repeat protein